jgi:hypothetical protein
MVREVQAVAQLFERTPEEADGYRKLCQSISYGDGMNLIEKRFNMTGTAQILGYQKNPDEVYRKVFVSAALEMFTTE